MILIADSSALIALAICDVLPFLVALYSEVRVPEAVYQEVIRPGKPQSEKLEAYLRDKVVAVRPNQFILMPYEVGVGEQEAMLLFRQLQAQVLLTDDLKARKVAQFNRIPVIGSLGILLKLKDEGHLPAIQPLIVALKRSGLFYSEALIQTILEAAGEAE
ncbi:MAG: DUF3368 domain-containing protein [Candidatus Sericytochromatia bacterium]